MINVSQSQRMSQKLSPNQLQYLKLLSLPIISLEQRIKEEMELNPLLEEGLEQEQEITSEQDDIEEPTLEQLQEQEKGESTETKEDEFEWEELMNDDTEGYKTNNNTDDDDKYEFPQPSKKTLSEFLIEQLHLLNLNDLEFILGEEVVGNIDDDGYLRRDLESIIQDLNLGLHINLTLEQAEKVLSFIQSFEPPGIGARNLQECLLIQIKALKNINLKTQEFALKILSDHFDDFSKRHYDELMKNLSITSEELKEINEVIQKLNPKPGEGEFTTGENYIIPDFYVHNNDNELLISVNDRNIPQIRINKTYQDLVRNRKKKSINSETKEFIRKKFEAAKLFVSCIRQRNETMMRVMQSIVEKQKEFFIEGEEYLKPMIYRDISEKINMDISTISRTVRGKYVETDYGVFELKYFFSEKIEKENGEEVSNKQVKSIIKEIINLEDHAKPFTDDEIVEKLKKDGFILARRTVAKYREQMHISVARLRKQIV